MCSNVLNTVQVLNLNIKGFKGEVIWHEFLGNNNRSGQIIDKKTMTIFIFYASGGIFIILMLFAISMAFKRKKVSKRPKVVYL